MPASLRAVFISRSRILSNVFAHSFLDAAFEPGLFGCHLKLHDAPARACAYWCRKHRQQALRDAHGQTPKSDTDENASTTLAAIKDLAYAQEHAFSPAMLNAFIFHGRARTTPRLHRCRLFAQMRS